MSSHVASTDAKVLLVANAAVGTFVTLEQTTEEHFDQTFGVNVRGTLVTVQKALPLLNGGASFLASDQSSYVVGANIYVDGGTNQI